MSEPHGSEHERLARVADWYSSHEGFYGRLVSYGFAALAPHFVGRTCLELGPADGRMTAMLLDAFETVCSVDGSAAYVDDLNERFGSRPGFSARQSLFEEFDPGRRFDTVLATHVLEHVADPVAVLTRVRDWVSGSGRLILLVPNARSLHRLAAVHMGLLDAPDALNELDHRLGHRRVYDLPLLRAHAADAGWTVAATGGVFLKPVSNGQIEEWFTPAMCDAFAALAADFPEHSAEVFAVCRVDQAA
jgi:2-polyprenyl-3-methyl-5-hydroxy-6-metoxy-1,4-benzoquinol methylase